VGSVPQPMQEQDKAARCSIPASGFIIGQFKSWSFAKALLFAQ
jgi:hypothetical protein